MQKLCLKSDFLGLEEGLVSLSFIKVKAFSRLYENNFVVFEKKHEELLRIFKGTPMASDMATYREAVQEAYDLNVQAGWISDRGEFDKSDYFDLLVKQDYSGRFIKRLEDVPVELKSDFLDFDEKEFASYLAELRQDCRCAYDEMAEVCGDLEYNLLSSDFLDMVWSIQDEMAEKDGLQFHALATNLCAIWEEYVGLAKSLLCMAHDFGDLDRDPSLMRALLFDE